MGRHGKRLAVVSDTHGLVDPALERLFEGVERIVHGGDIVGEQVLTRLEDIAPVDAISGNCDGPPLSTRFPDADVFEFDGERLLVIHDLGRPDRPRPKAAELIRKHQPRVVISGHSHRGHLEVRDGRLFVSPGSAGRKRFKLLRSAALLVFEPERIEARLLSLEGRVGEVVTTASLPRAT